MAKVEQYNKFSCVTYLSIEQLQKLLDDKLDQIESYAFAEHDKDIYSEDKFDDEGNLIHAKGEIKIRHIHLYVKTESKKSYEQFKKWFDGFVDDKGQKINTYFEICRSSKLTLAYLTHKYNLDKYQYDSSIVHKFNIDEKSVNDNIYYDIITKMLYGDNYLDLVKQYGRDFVIHYNNYKSLVIDIRQQQQLTNFNNDETNKLATIVDDEVDDDLFGQYEFKFD